MATTSTLSSASALAGAGTLSSAGIGSGLDVNGIVTRLMDIERMPITNLDTKTTETKAVITAYGTLKSSLASLQTATQALYSANTFSATKATVAEATLFSATTTTGAQPGSYSIEVTSLAKTQKLLTTGFASLSDDVGAGTLTFDFGTYTTSGEPATTSFTENPEKQTRSVTIPADAASLADVASAINAAKIGVSATVINDGSSYYLSVSPIDSGASNALRIGVSDADGDNTDAAGLSRLAFDKSTGGVQRMGESIVAADAVLKIDGVTIHKPLNVIDDAIAGVTLTLTKEDPGVPTTLTVARDNTVLSTALSDFVKAYNSTSGMLGTLLAFNAKTGETGALQSEGTVRNVQLQLRNALSRTLNVAGGGIGSLSALGVSFQRDGTLAFDSMKLQSATMNPQNDIEGFLKGTEDAPGLAANMGSLLGSMLSNEGLLTARVNGLNDRISLYDARKVALNQRMAVIENRYRAQFSALDKLVASMNQTSTYLTQQLANLPKISGTGND